VLFGPLMERISAKNVEWKDMVVPVPTNAMVLLLYGVTVIAPDALIVHVAVALSSSGVVGLNAVMKPVKAHVAAPLSGNVIVTVSAIPASGGFTEGSNAMSTVSSPLSTRSPAENVWSALVPMWENGMDTRVLLGPPTDRISAKKPVENDIVVPVPTIAIRLLLAYLF
jgi:hypothetical protein